MVSRGQGKSIEESDNDAAFQRKFNLVQEIYELLPPYTIFILCCASRWMFQSQTLEVFRFFSCEELEAVYYIRGFWQRLMASHYCPNYFSYVSSGCGGGSSSRTKTQWDQLLGIQTSVEVKSDYFCYLRKVKSFQKSLPARTAGALHLFPLLGPFEEGCFWHMRGEEGWPMMRVWSLLTSFDEK